MVHMIVFALVLSHVDVYVVEIIKINTFLQSNLRHYEYDNNLMPKAPRSKQIIIINFS